MNRQRPLTQLAHELLAHYLHPGDIAIDATAGNGHDTLFLARQANPGGRVHAFDIQAQALEASRMRLKEAGLEVQGLHLQGHEHMLTTLPPHYQGRVAAITFNLGYLPGSDHRTITRKESTLQALQQSLQLLRPGGALSLLAYRGHEGGMEEAQAVQAWCQQQAGLSCERYESPGPVLYFCVFGVQQEYSG